MTIKSCLAPLVFTICLACGTHLAAQIAASTNLPAPNVPQQIALPPGHTEIFVAHAQGFQVYKCTTGKGPPAWTLAGPDAKLFDDHRKAIGTHFAVPGEGGAPAPSWKLSDGSQIVGAKTAGVDAPDGKGVQWLLLKVVDNQHRGVLADVTAVQRVNTSGGQPPESGCTSTTAGATTKVHYTADYYFSK
jgi:hypothetical protein